MPVDQVASEVSPRAGVRIVRDKAYNVPHVSGDTRADTMFGAGYATAQDRLFFMDVLRHTGRARLTELIGPGEDDANVKADAEQLKIADYDEGELQSMIDRAREAAGPEGATIQADLDAYVAGVNQYILQARTDPSKLPAEYPALGRMPADWKATDTVAIASLIGGIFGKGGGGEARPRRRSPRRSSASGPPRAARCSATSAPSTSPRRRSPPPSASPSTTRAARSGRRRHARRRLDPGPRPGRDGRLAPAEHPATASPACRISRSAGCRSSACSPTRCSSAPRSPSPATRSASWARRSATTRPRS